MSAAPAEVRVRGGASAEELAAALTALLGALRRAPAEDRYATWRRTRLAALRRDL